MRALIVLAVVYLPFLRLMAVETDSLKPFKILRPVPERLADRSRGFQSAPGIAISPKGRLWVTWMTGGKTEDEENCAVIATSGDGGKTWSSPLLAIDCEGPLRVLDPGIWTDPNGRIRLLYGQVYGFWDGRCGLWETSPLDPEDPNTGWTEPRRLCDGYLKNKPTILKSGRWLLPVEFFNSDKTSGGGIGSFHELPPEFSHDSSRYQAANVFCSDDECRTVTYLGQSMVPSSDRCFRENMIVERRDGLLWMLARMRYGIGEAFSKDGGKTWTEMRPSAIKAPNARFYIGRLKSGALLLVKNGSTTWKKTKRESVTAFVSYDEGRTWRGGLVLDPRRHSSYPDVIEDGEGFIHCVTDFDRTGAREILHHRFTEADVRAAKIVTAGSRLRDVINRAGPTLRLGSPFCHGMVLQRETHVPIWGVSEPRANVRVAFDDQSAETLADAEGRWKLRMQTGKASKEARTLAVSCGDDVVSVTNVLVGEVWLASGQSNMEMPLWGRDPRFRDRQGGLIAGMVRCPTVRVADVSCREWSVDPRRETPVVWKPLESDYLRDGKVSAVAVYYALELYHALDIPIGVIVASWGGTPIDAWTPRDGLVCHPELDREISYPVSSDFKGGKLGGVWNPWQQPGVLYNAMLAPIAPYACRGMIWFQGCQNVWEGRDYRAKMHALYDGFSRTFENAVMKLYFVQLAANSRYEGHEDEFAAIREQQVCFAEEETNAGMVTAADVGNWDDIHFNEKEIIARRLAALALSRDYGFASVNGEVPCIESIEELSDGKLKVVFKNARSLYVYNRNRSLAANIEVADRKGNFRSAMIENVRPNGEIVGNYIILSAPGVSRPCRVRYLYSAPFEGSLYNEYSLPVGYFRKESTGQGLLNESKRVE